MFESQTRSILGSGDVLYEEGVLHLEARLMRMRQPGKSRGEQAGGRGRGLFEGRSEAPVSGAGLERESSELQAAIRLHMGQVRGLCFILTR